MNLFLNHIFSIFSLIYKCILHVSVGHTSLSFHSALLLCVGHSFQRITVIGGLLHYSQLFYMYFIWKILHNLFRTQVKSCLDQWIQMKLKYFSVYPGLHKSCQLCQIQWGGLSRGKGDWWIVECVLLLHWAGVTDSLIDAHWWKQKKSISWITPS